MSGSSPDRSLSRNRSSVDEADAARFAALADDWWDERGPFAPLHRFTPVRLAYIRDRLFPHFQLDDGTSAPFEGLSILDVGCGGGLLSNPLRRLGASVTAIDVTDETIGAAQAHAYRLGHRIDFRVSTIEQLAATDARFDVVVASEVVEHVADLDSFADGLAGVLNPGGALIMTTINRTLRSLALAKIGMEYVLRWVPPGTHDWRKFPTPRELTDLIVARGIEVRDVSGMVPDPLTGGFRLSGDTGVNYALFGVKL